MRVSKARDGTLFVLANLVGGFIHYLFQIVASRALDAEGFARLSGWHAHLGLGFAVAGLAQYAACFYPPARPRRGLALAGVVSVIALVPWWAGGAPVGVATALAVITLATAFGWSAGQAQIRLDFLGLSLAGLAVAVAKLALAFAGPPRLETFSFAVAACYLPGLVILNARLWFATPPPREGQRSWAAPVVLSLAANLVPQIDLVLIQHAAPAAFASFARASLFYKGIYFFVLIFAQWILPRQIRGEGRGFKLGLVCAFALAASLSLSATAPLFARFVFHWDEAPGFTLIFLSCANMSLLTLLFLGLQGDAAAGRIRRASVPLLALGLEAAAELTFGWPVEGYLGLAIAVQALTLWRINASTPKPSFTPPPSN